MLIRRESFHLFVSVKLRLYSQNLTEPVAPITVIARAISDSVVEFGFGDQIKSVKPVVVAFEPIASVPSLTTVPLRKNLNVQTLCETLRG